MKITYLGTGAADWNITLHKEEEGFRRNSSALIDDCLLIDPGPNVMDALETFGKDVSKIKYIINTHKHSDHYNEETLSNLPIAQFFEFEADEEKQIGNYNIKSYKANHSTCKDAVHFIINDGEKKIFYGLDGAWLMYDEVAAIKEHGIDYAVLDATIGDIPGDYRIFEHNNLNMIKEIKDSLKEYVKRFCISHMARTLHKSHNELTADMREFDIEVAFDGMETKI